MSIHDLVLATIQQHHANANLRLERLRSLRESLSTVTAGGQSRAMQVGRQIREAEAVERGWHRVSVAAFSANVADLLEAQTEADPGPVDWLSKVPGDAPIQVGWRSTSSIPGAHVSIRCMVHPFASSSSEPLMSDQVEIETACCFLGCKAQLS